MDTITHGIAGALIGKAAFGGQDFLALTRVTKKRIITFVLVLGAMFPDSDVLREFFSSNQMLIVTWHRSITHSLLCLPIWAGLLAGLTIVIARWRKWETPSFLALYGLWAVGILSHIFLDLVTTFGTMIWSPIEWSRPAWDLLFIVDFAFTAILLVPQLLAWTFEKPKNAVRRAMILWLIFVLSPVVIAKIGQSVGAPISNTTVFAAIGLFTILFLVPAFTRLGQEIPYVTWNRAGLALAVLYLAGAAFAHRAAFERTEQFAAALNVKVLEVGALPLPPSLWHWDGLVLSPHGVYETRIDLSDEFFRKATTPSTQDPDAIERTFYPSATPNRFTEKASQLKEVQQLLWFARFPVTRFHREGENPVVEIHDARFPQIRPGRPPSFTYRVVFGPDEKVIAQGWEGR